MNFFKLLAAGTAAGIIAAAFRHPQGDWVIPARALTDSGNSGNGDQEPFLGYDGLDEDALQDWLDRTETDRSQLLSMIRYEAGHRGRQPVLATMVDLL